MDEIIRNPIGSEEVAEATLTLQKYKNGKANLEKRIINGEQWWRLRGDEIARGRIESTNSAWLWNVVTSHHATSMDNYPTANILPREESDQGEAQTLASIIPVILAQNDFEETYSDSEWRRLKTGLSFYKTVWDSSKYNGLGDVSISDVSPLSLFWEPGITDIQASHNVFHVELKDNRDIEATFPETKGKLSNSTLTVSEYVYDDALDTTEKSAVIDWYYKKQIGNKTVLHFCKYVNEIVLYSSENENPEQGYYDHGKYPFVPSVLFPVEGTIAGYGYIDIGKSTQQDIDSIDYAIVENTLDCATPRYFVRQDGAVNEDEYRDRRKKFIHTNGNLGDDAIRPIEPMQMTGTYVTVLQNKIQELKEVSGNRDVSNGSTTGGVTAASGLAALQEAGARLDRDSGKGAYRAYKEVVYFVIELIRQFYDLPRQFRITGETGEPEFTQFSNRNIKPQTQMVLGQDMGYRVPEFDIDVVTQKASPYQKQTQNELMIQFFQLGFFNPEMADQALACLKGMDFDQKQPIIKTISQNKTLYDQVMQLTQIIVQLCGAIDPSGQLAQQYAMVLGGNQQQMPQGGGLPSLPQNEPTFMENARARVAAQGDPNRG